MTYYARINSRNELVDIQPSIMLKDEYDSTDVQNIEVTKEYWDNWLKYGEGYYVYIDNNVIVNPELDNIRLSQVKAFKIEVNDHLRDDALLGGVIYQNVLFDSDTDQKINLLAKIDTLSDTSTIVWYGMDNTALLCTKTDLIAIGGLIDELHTFCWENNAYIKEQIINAQTIEELNEIEINYDRHDT